MMYNEDDVKRAVEAGRQFVLHSPDLSWALLTPEEFYKRVLESALPKETMARVPR